MKLTPKNKEGGIFVDDRGVIRFINDFPTGIKRMYQVENLRAGSIRAFHGHLKEKKFVYVPRGIVVVKIIPISVNMKEGKCIKCVPSGTASCLVSFTLSSFKPSILQIDAGYYNGFKTLTDDAIIQFYSTSTLEESKKDDYRLPWDFFSREIWEEKPR